jgi:iron complex transport system substrate-binding protein
MAVIATLCGCNTTALKDIGEQPLGFYQMKYSGLFGIAKFKDYEQLFYINNGDTIWSIRNIELPSKEPRVAVLSSVFAGFIEALGLQQSIVAVDNDKYFNDPLILDRIQKGEVISIGEEGQVQTEKLLSVKPDVLVASSFGFHNQSMKDRLAKMDIQVLMCDNFKEQHPLARAEWIKFFGFLYQCGPKADSIFTMIEKNYLAISDSAKALPNKPKVMTEAMYSEVWNIPGGDSYTAKLIEDAGGKYIFAYKKELYTYPLNLESVLKEAGQADIWIHVNQFKSKSGMLSANSRYALFKPFSSNRIYNNNKRENQFGGNDFWEKGAVRADLVLRDLVNIFSGDKISSDKLYFYTLVD